MGKGGEEGGTSAVAFLPELVKNAVSRAPPQLLNATVLERGLGVCIIQSSPGGSAAPASHRRRVGTQSGQSASLSPCACPCSPTASTLSFSYAPSPTLPSPAHSSSSWRFGGGVVIDKGQLLTLAVSSRFAGDTERPFPEWGRRHALLSLCSTSLSDILAFGFF